MSTKLKITAKKDNFSEFVSKLQDLTSISDILKIKIDSKNILMYSMVSNDVAVLALKSYYLNTNDYFEDIKSEEVFDFVIINSSKFVKNLKFFNEESKITIDLISKKVQDEEIMHVRSALFTNGKLKITCVGGELSKIKNINKSILDSRMNIKNSKWGFQISMSDFTNIKKLSSINSEDKILNIIVTNGIVSFVEDQKWELEVDEINKINTKITFNKKYLSNINENDIIEFKIFETFLLVKDDVSNLLFSFETDFNDE